MKKVVIALVAIAVAIGFVSMSFAGTVEKAKGEIKTESGTAKFKAKETTKQQAGQTVTTDKAKLTTQTPQSTNILYGKIKSYSDKDGKVMFLRYKDATLNEKTAENLQLTVHAKHPTKNHFQVHQGKTVKIWTTNPNQRVSDLVKDGLISPEWQVMPFTK